MKYLPEKHPIKAEIAAREERTEENDKKDVLFVQKTRYCAHPKRSTLL